MNGEQQVAKSKSAKAPAPQLAEGIVEVLTIGAFDELPWLFEMEKGGKLSISLMANQAVDIVVCSEADYDEWIDSGAESDRPAFGFLESNRSACHALQFRSPESGLVAILVVNPNATEAELAISLLQDQRSFNAPFLASQ